MMTRTTLMLAALLAVCVAQSNYLTTFKYGGTNCNDLLYVEAVKGACTTPSQGACQQVSSTTSKAVSCVVGSPGGISNSVTMMAYAANSCSGEPSGLVSWKSGICVQLGPDSWTVSCSSSQQLFVAYWSTNNVCLGPASVWTLPQGCSAVPSQGLPANISGAFVSTTCTGPPCFHETSKIVLPESKKVATLDSLLRKEHPECHVPHQVHGAGVAISSTCSADKLRLTNDHLVYTNRGLITAAEVRVGDDVFGDESQSKKCQVTKVESEYHQKYFALNCRESEVLANGVKTSTFGVVHRVPALWMKWASKIFGVERASAIGDTIASLLAKVNLL